MKLMSYLIGIVGVLFMVSLWANTHVVSIAQPNEDLLELESLILTRFECGEHGAEQCINTVCKRIPIILTKQRKKACFNGVQDFHNKINNRYSDYHSDEARFDAFFDELCGPDEDMPLIDKAERRYNQLSIGKKIALGAIGLNQRFLTDFKKDMYSFCKKKVNNES